MFKRFFYDKTNIIRRAFYYGKTKETCTSSTNGRMQKNHYPPAPQKSTAEDIQSALKGLLGGTINEMMEAEMDDHLGYEKSESSDNDGYKCKQVNSRYGSIEIEVHRIVNQLFSHR